MKQGTHTGYPLLEDVLDVNLLDRMVREGFISRRAHKDDAGLLVFNYTTAAAYSRTWNDATLKCRGLIVRGSEVVARPFPKFFNVGEYETIPPGPFIAFDKADGSLGIPYVAPDGRIAIATRGSFHSEQAEWATAHLREDADAANWIMDEVYDYRTPLFEIVYPENRIVCNYGEFCGLVLLATIDTRTGRDAEPADEWPGPVVQRWDDLAMDDLAGIPGDNREGFVLLFQDGTRLKWKYDEYVRLHKIITGVTERTIWEMLSQRISIEPLAEVVPDEFYEWMKATARGLEEQFAVIEKECLAAFSDVNLAAPRREIAEFILQQKHPAILFCMLDDKPYAHMIWKMVYPPFLKPQFTEEA